MQRIALSRQCEAAKVFISAELNKFLKKLKKFMMFPTPISLSKNVWHH